MNTGKKLMIAVVTIALILALTACSGDTYTAADATAQVKGNLDEIYLGVYDPEYLNRVAISEEEAEATYLSGMEVEAGYFISYYGLENVSDEQYQEIIDLHKDIYARAKYEVQPAVKQSDGTFAVKVVFSPIDVHQQVDNEWSLFMDDFWSQYIGTDVNAMSDEQYAQWESMVLSAYTDAVIEEVRSKIPGIGYGEENSVVIQVVKDSYGYYVMDETGFGSLDALMITYP